MKFRPIALSALLCAFAAQADESGAETRTETVIMPVMEIVGTPEQGHKLPGSAQVIDSETLSASRVFSTNEALRKISGLNVRDEEGFGLRPNIGIRGLNPTRSTKILLLEDGIPLAYGPYGDNASYYHPPVERFDRIEVLKGAGQNIYGPQTVGGVINYITPAPPHDFGGRVGLAAGNRGYLNGRLSVGGDGFLFDATGKESDGARDNIHSGIYDLNFKAALAPASGHALTFRANSYQEDSQVTYSGLTDAEFANLGARYNPFKNDTFDATRQGASLTHQWTLSRELSLLTNVYYSQFGRDWWRQSSTTTDGQCGGAFTTARNNGTVVDPDTCASAQGRLRNYYTYGVEPRLNYTYSAFGLQHELQTGLRYHVESQKRQQKNGTSSQARDGAIQEDNIRLTDAVSGFVQNRIESGKFSVTPGLRIESIRYERINRCTNPPTCTNPQALGRSDLMEALPSLGATYQLDANYLLFAGVHRGFAPPRTEDIINGTGTAVDVEAEDSRNYEIGLRGNNRRGLSYEATLFRNDFLRQIAVGSIAGGSTPLAEGESLYQGLELNGRYDLGRRFDSLHNPFVELAYTHLEKAEMQTPFINVVSGAVIAGSAEGNTLPYAPQDTLTTTLGYSHPRGVEARLELVYVGSQFSDFANSQAPNGTGQIGEISSYTVWNTAVNYTVQSLNLTVFVAAKNLFDKVYITDRTRGIQTGAPRLVQGGVEYSF